MVQVIVGFEVEALYVLERGHDLRIYVRLAHRGDLSGIAQPAAGSGPDERNLVS